MTKTLLLFEKEAILKNPKYQVLKDREGRYYFRLCARNGEIILTGNAFSEKHDCFEDIDTLKMQGDFEFIERDHHDRKLFYFQVENDQGKVIVANLCLSGNAVVIKLLYQRSIVPSILILVGHVVASNLTDLGAVFPEYLGLLSKIVFTFLMNPGFIHETKLFNRCSVSITQLPNF